MATESPGYLSALTHYLLTTGILGAALWVLRRWLLHQQKQKGFGAVGRVVGMIPLTPASRLFVVAIGETYYLVPEGQAGEPQALNPEQVEGLRAALDGQFEAAWARARARRAASGEGIHAHASRVVQDVLKTLIPAAGAGRSGEGSAGAGG